MKRILVIGSNGEVGSAIIQIEREAGNEVFEIDLGHNNDRCLDTPDICHICIPYSKTFVDDVEKYLNYHCPKLTIINSTVIPNTTNIVCERTNMRVVHSPVMGIHPNLKEGIETFTKLIGGELDAAIDAQNHFGSLGINSRILKNSYETELGKILSTTYYGWNIIFSNLVNDLCNTKDVDYTDVYVAFNEVYNEGYDLLDKYNVVRPILYPSKGEIGGHCISNNIKLLPKSKLKKILQVILDD